MTEQMKLLSVGFGIGILSGLLGVGGGVFLVPVMVTYFCIAQHQAQAISLAVVIPSSIIGSIIYGYHGNIDTTLALNLAIGGIIGASISARYVKKIPAQRLKQLFGIMLLLIGIRMVLS